MIPLTIYVTGLVLIAAVSWAVAGPFFRSGRPARNDEVTGRNPWEVRRDVALEAIRDAEIDFHVGKLSATDYRELRARLEAEAVEAIHHVEEKPGEPEHR